MAIAPATAYATGWFVAAAPPVETWIGAEVVGTGVTVEVIGGGIVVVVDKDVTVFCVVKELVK
jgi:hypothetical protein